MMEGIANRISPLPSSVSAARKLWFRGALSLAVTLGLTAVSPVSQAQTLTVLYSFASYTDGYPPSAVIRDAAGNLYGTTFYGGTPGNGTVFKLDASGNKTVLHAFTTTHSDGRSPSAGLVLRGQDFYGTTTAGGTSASGTVFKLDKNSKESVLYSFTGGADGGNPFAGLIRDASGNLYGTTFNGGIGSYGTVFKLDATGKETVLYKFTGGEDGQNPGLGVVQDAAGNLYGMTGIGGDLSCTYDVGGGCGTVFKLDRNGNKTVLHSFSGKADGAYGSAMTLDAAGNLYGATQLGGDPTCGCGTVFKMYPNGGETVLYSFTGGADGSSPVGELAHDAAGNLYGTTQLGGDPTCGCGTVFKLDKTGKKTVLHSFAGADGSYPFAGVMLDKAGNLYGTTNTGGAFGFGTIFKITP
ncbi:MAG TPA: choice-of-anchor tandem repeat GloVer-containing protein [Candidatus Acidoferrum sp.]|nr:choice-of-anchor tandem repeat GloVer-containing protein [Candidatus Acidoferrum sp.]